MSHFCTICASFQDTEHDPSSGNVFCVRCGHVIEENTIVSEVTFAEHSDGTSSMVGQFVPESGVRGMMRGAPGTHAESRQITLSKARRRIQLLADQLLISANSAEQAHRVFKLALNVGFTRGRKAGHVAAACLYVACRRDKTPHMLLDFSEVLQTDVFLLGHTFLQLIRKLNFQLPLVEPFLYVRRFAAQLEFGDKYNQVVSTALKLVGSMKRDWIQTGRRPAGLCAASILISARIHNFRRTQEEVSRVVKMCAATVGKRLKEFEDTPVAQMTPEEFENANDKDFDQECDPPAFLRSEMKKRLEEALKKSKKSKKSKKGKEVIAEVEVEDEEDEEVEEDDSNDESQNESDGEATQEETSRTDEVRRADISEMTGMQREMDGFDRAFDEANRRAEEKEKKKEKRREKRKFLEKATCNIATTSLHTQDSLEGSGREDDGEEEEGDDIDESSSQVAQTIATTIADETQVTDMISSDEDSQSEQRDAEDSGDDILKDLERLREPRTDANEELLSDSDLDEELNEYIVTDEEERQLREKVWDALNAKYLVRMAEKRRQRELEAQSKGQHGRTRKQQQRKTPAERRQQQQQQAPAQSAAEAAASMLRKRTRRPIPGMSNMSSLFSTQDEEIDRISTVVVGGGGDHFSIGNSDSSLAAKRRRLEAVVDTQEGVIEDEIVDTQDFGGDTLRELQQNFVNGWAQ